VIRRRLCDVASARIAISICNCGLCVPDGFMLFMGVRVGDPPVERTSARCHSSHASFDSIWRRVATRCVAHQSTGRHSPGRPARWRGQLHTRRLEGDVAAGVSCRRRILNWFSAESRSDPARARRPRPPHRRLSGWQALVQADADSRLPSRRCSRQLREAECRRAHGLGGEEQEPPASLGGCMARRRPHATQRPTSCSRLRRRAARFGPGGVVKHLPGGATGQPHILQGPHQLPERERSPPLLATRPTWRCRLATMATPQVAERGGPEHSSMAASRSRQCRRLEPA
jgi:hypothetical protein